MREILSGIHIQRRQRMKGATGFGFDGQINMENLAKYEFASLQAARAISFTTYDHVHYQIAKLRHVLAFPV